MKRLNFVSAIALAVIAGPAAQAQNAGWYVGANVGQTRAKIDDDGIALAEGQVAEVCLGLEPWLRDVAGRLARGYVLAIDYGYDAADRDRVGRRPDRLGDVPAIPTSPDAAPTA